MMNSSSPSSPSSMGDEGAAALRLALTLTHLILVLIGTFNLLVIFLVIVRPYMRSITNVYMVSLCLADFIYLVNLSFVAATQLNNKSWPFGNAICTLFHGSEATGKYASVLFVVLLAADRYCAMCRPSLCSKYRNYRTAIVLSLAAWLAALAISLPLYIVSEEIPIRLHENPFQPPSHVLCIAKWSGHGLARMYISLSSVFIFVIPLVLIIYCYFHILNKLREAVKGSKRLRRASSTRAPYHRVTRLVLWVVIFHVICWSPYWIFNLLSSIFRVRISSQLERIVINIIHLFPYINCALNPLLYAVTADNFRIAFRSVFCCKAEATETENGKPYIATRSTYHRTGTTINGSPVLGERSVFQLEKKDSVNKEETTLEKIIPPILDQIGVRLEPHRSVSTGRLSIRRSFCNGDEAWRQCSQDEIRKMSR
ncbi:unnamed protein product, partial [Mesorhabditis belari]|uniref:G-protein coupled receptors family 1 profile domain-containing protein n=1 Tax=Mesorhabditis belari TaxID=2138241 RepID=A0AAF3FIV3_9BILA